MILRTNTATHLGQAIGSVRQLRGLEELAFLDQLQPAGNVVVDRAPPLAVGIAATQVTACLKRGGLWIKLTIDFPWVRISAAVVAESCRGTSETALN
jgi:hypothetical protein